MKLTLANDKTTTATNSDKMEPFSTLTTSRAREHIPIREILNRQEIRNLMKELQPAQSQAIKPKISYDQLKTIVRTSGVELEELVSWREETWELPAPNLAVKKQTCQYQGKGKWLPIKKILLDRQKEAPIYKEILEVFPAADLTDVRGNDACFFRLDI